MLYKVDKEGIDESMRKKKSEYGVGKNPSSLANLNRDGRLKSEEIYGEPKRRRTLTVTDSGWEATAEFVKKLGFSSVSEFLEEYGRRQGNVVL